MKELNVALAVVGGLTLVLGLLSRPLDRSRLSPPLLAFLLGAMLSPHALAWLNPSEWGSVETLLEETTRLTLGISLMGIALRLPPRFPLRHWRSLFLLLAIGMPAMFMISALLAYWTLGLTWLIAMLIGASVCATDPVLASSIVTGNLARESLPGSFRHLLSSESGANDGLAYPLVLLPVLLLTAPEASVWMDWFIKVWLWEVGAGIVIGLLLGWVSGRALRWSEAKAYLDQPSFLSITVALTLLVLGVGKLLGTDSILAVFAAGLAFDQVVGGKERSEEDNVQEAVNLFFTLPVFVLFGLIAPWPEWMALGWSGVLLALFVMLLRRLPVIWVLRPWLPPVEEKRIALGMGWFGPVGVSALFYAAMIARRTENDMAWVVGSLIVLVSIIVHGVTAAPFAKCYYRKEQQAHES